MKRNIYLLGLGLLFSTTACVDLDQEAQSFLTEEQFIEQPQTIDIVQKTVTGLYHNLWGENYGFCCRRLRLEVSAGEIIPAFSKPNNPLGNIHNLYPTAGVVDTDAQKMWDNYWSVITATNKIINGTPIPETDDAAIYKAAVGEAYFLRAFTYFQLVRTFGDVPFITSGEEALNKSIQRTSVATIYDEIIVPDLEYACKNLPGKSRSGSSDTPSKWAAKTLLADVYMTMAGWPLKKGTEYYAKAAAETKDIIEHAELKLTDKYEDLWKESKKVSDKEHLFAVHNSVIMGNPSQYGKSFYSSDHKYGGWNDYFASPIFAERHPEDDRLAWNIAKVFEGKNGTMIDYKNSINKCPLISKFKDYDVPQGKSVSAQTNGITPIYRYADVLLMYAEASNLAEGAPNKLAKECLKKVQDRANYPEQDRPAVNNKEEFDKAIFAERGWEFYCEGKRWFELVRREKVAEYRNIGPKKPGDKGLDEEYGNFYDSSIYKANNHYYFPIPIEQIKMTGWNNNAGY